VSSRRARARGLVLATALALLPPPSSVAAPLLAVVAKHADRVELFDPATGVRVAALATGPGPHEVAAAPDGGTLYVSLYGNDPDVPGTHVEVFDVERRTSRTRFALGRYRNPHGLAVSRDGTRLWVTCEGPGAPDAVLELDARSGELLHAWETGQRGTHMVVASRDEERLWATAMGAGTVTGIERATGRVRTLETGAGAAAPALSPDGRWLWVANEAAGTLSVIDTTREAAVATLPAAGPGPVRVRFTPDGRQVWVPHFAGGSVAVFDAADRRRLDRIRLPGSGDRGPIGILVTPDGETAYVAHMDGGYVAEIDVATRRVRRRLDTGAAPDGLAWIP